MLGFVWTGRNPTTGLESTKLRARTRIFISTKFQPRVRLVIPILRMRNTLIQTFYGQIASFPSIMIRMLHFMMTKPNFFGGIKGAPFFPLSQKFSCVFGHLCWISAMFLATFLPRYPTPKFDHFQHIRDARAAAAASTSNMISWFIKSLSSSSVLRSLRNSTCQPTN